MGVHSGDVEIDLPGVFRFEGRGLKFDDHVALEAGMIEKQIDEEFIPIHFKPVLSGNESKACWAYQARTLVSSIRVSRVTMWNQGNWSADC